MNKLLSRINVSHCINLLVIVMSACMCGGWTGFWLAVTVLSEVLLLKQGKVRMEP